MFASLRAGRATFWYLAADRLVAAVIVRTADEPLLEACAASYASSGQPALFAPGIVELAWLLGADRFGHVAALAAPFCTIDQIDQAAATGRQTGAGPSSHAVDAMVADRVDGFGASGGMPAAAVAEPTAAERVAIVRDAPGASGRASSPGLRVRAQLRAVSQAQGLFRRARLRLLALDCEACALVTLADTLGVSAPDQGHLYPSSAQPASRQPLVGQSRSAQPLAAVSVSPEAETAAHALGDDLAVPVGLALAWFGAHRAR